MGQTQILMIVLAVIIVAIAVTVGISQFSESALQANRDAIASDCMRVVASGQQWYKKPTSLGGGGNSFTGMTFGSLGIDSSSANGTVSLTVDSGNQITVTGTGNENTTGGSAVEVTMEYYATQDSFATSDNM